MGFEDKNWNDLVWGRIECEEYDDEKWSFLMWVRAE